MPVVMGATVSIPPFPDLAREAGEAEAEIIRCLKRFVVREIFGHLCRPTKSAPADQNAN
jgi:hypothetical protein